MKGIVKWFNAARGYGFIGPEVGGKDVFVYWSEIQQQGYKQLKPEQIVEFEVAPGPRGLPQAMGVKVIEE